MLTLRDAEIEMPSEFVGEGADPNSLGPASHPFWEAGFPLKLKNAVTMHPFVTALGLLAVSLGTYAAVRHSRKRR